ncbi:violaxanthin de-epoxidase-related [Melia azedarach]|uniref:Violaxanthin de-epoxidase-related n=1 Tax=Melia azedarach TaxID=155640 RepID=A0ACC1XX41_MELAZ|nr:violaxanthin de-epoxidase-related [Melia azedarach]
MKASLESPLTKRTCDFFQLNRRFTVSATGSPPFIHYHKSATFPVALLSRPGNETSLRAETKVPAVLEKNESAVNELAEPPVRIVALVGQDAVSPLKCATWEEVMLHTAKRLKWVDEGYEMVVFTDNLTDSRNQTFINLQRELSRADIFIIEDHMSHSDKKGTLFDKITGFSQPNKTNESAEVIDTISEAWERHNSDDIRFCLLVMINAYIRPVPVLKNLRSKGFSTLSCMVQNCGPQILNCLLDPNCRKALQCLNQCSPVDQVCNYRCIASYESPNLEAFSLCVLQKNNCLELDAKIPEKPYVPPMVKFRGKDLCHETAEDLFVGWLGNLDWSWRVVAGQNPAYDQFPCQYQLFYRGKAKGSFWYEPVFQVRTLEGKLVWRRRKYRVKRDKIPGTFYFSVLDNGVVSKEFWTIVDVADDFSWGLFHYHGAARVAGQSYTGAVLVSPDGMYPNETERRRLVDALERCGIKEWELFTVDNCSCKNPPLGIPEGSSLHAVIDVKDQNSSCA